MTDHHKIEPRRRYRLSIEQSRWLDKMLARGKPNSAWEQLGRDLQFDPNTHERIPDDPYGFYARPTRRVHDRVTEDMVHRATVAYDAAGKTDRLGIMCGMRTALTAVFDQLDCEAGPAKESSPKSHDNLAVLVRVRTGLKEYLRDPSYKATGDLAMMRELLAAVRDATIFPVAHDSTESAIDGSEEAPGGELAKREAIAARGLSRAPRVTLEHLESLVVDEHYHVYRTLTICVLTLRNGYTVSGQSASADPANFDRQKGREISRGKALAEIWPLEGYLLRQRLHDDAEREARYGCSP